ncbi:hypothetical protein AVEN_41519-1 [Araneus ventricosus]|uniref:Vitellogenin domain-containing protein n=1 Tax=Araneus ventricosus TaxID=182803 RepID=A0A4Y2UE70_ARAVE|nr:hypothetical protein AVEN_41519-1 [Araneus ventricosus]
MAICLVAFALVAISALGRSDPLRYDNEGFVTRINCQAREPQHFLYSSITDLWGMAGGQIVLSADVVLRCLGDDSGGKYGPEALKYKVEIANLLISENRENKMQSMVREKRGAREFFSRSWTEVKDFFKRVFGRKPRPQPEVSRAAHPDPTEAPPTEEPEEDLDMSEYNSLYSAPFQFIQLANGSIPEIRFAENEVDTRVKNFKRHLVDAFSTQLSFDQRKQKVVEQSVIGEHTSNYNIS